MVSSPRLNECVSSASNGLSNNASTIRNDSVAAKEISSAAAAVVKASTPLKNNTSSDLVRQRIKSFDYGQPSGALVSNGTKSYTSDSGDPEGDSLTVSKRRQMFEGGSATNAKLTMQKSIISLGTNETSHKVSASVAPSKDTVSPENCEPQPAITSNLETSKSKFGMGDIQVEEKVVGCGGIQRAVSPQMQPIAKDSPSDSPIGNTNRSVGPLAGSPVPSPFRASPILPPPSPQPQIAAPPGFEDSIEGQSESLTSDTITIEITPEMGLCARALYDYQAGK